jgi:hypothetical protein
MGGRGALQLSDDSAFCTVLSTLLTFKVYKKSEVSVYIHWGRGGGDVDGHMSISSSSEMPKESKNYKAMQPGQPANRQPPTQGVF